MSESQGRIARLMPEAGFFSVSERENFSHQPLRLGREEGQRGRDGGKERG